MTWRRPEQRAPELDAADVRILSALQEDGSLSVAAVAEKVNLSTNACWRRIRRLEDEGVIRRRVTLLDPEALGLDVTVFVSVRASEHSEAWLQTFADAVREMPEVVEFYRMSGEVDYLLKIQVSSIAEYDSVYKRLVSKVKLVDVSSAFAMEELKHTTALPLPEPKS
ncbi:Lrp/AsnC family transcriptional regulator [Phenylobacterium sp.]|uniref:Lrp/AsnC family transcriptional regulator n=1 Tax=Phenylobacterium sp. TaxID=1871053 RepID=UPI00395A120A